MSTYCVKCRSKTGNKDEKVEGKMLKSSCKECNTKKSQFLKKEQYGGYEDIHQKLAEETYKKEPAEQVDGHILDKSLSNKKTLVYHNPETKATIVAHKGTDVKDKNDLKNDVKAILGIDKNTKRAQNAKRITKEAEKKYGDNLTGVGHSLGGRQAELASGKHKVVTFNGAVTPLAKTANNPNIERNVTKGDVISNLALLKDKKHTKVSTVSGANKHTLSNFKR